MHRLRPTPLVRAFSVYEVFLLAAAIWFLGKFVRYAFPPLFEEFQGFYGVSSTEVGIAYSAFLALYAITQFPSGALADRFGSIQVITIGAITAGGGALLLLFTPPFAALAFAMAVIGAGTGAHKTVSIRLLSNVYPTHLGRALGVFDTVGAMGGVVAPLLIAAILSFAIGGWPALFGLTGVVFLLIAITFFSRIRGHPDLSGDSRGTDQVLPLRSYGKTFRRPRVLAFTLLTILVAFAYNGLVSFLPLMLTTEGGVSPALASALYSILFVASIVQVVSGEAADRFGPLRTIIVCLGGATLGMVGLLVIVSIHQGDLTATTGLVGIGAIVLLIGLGSHGYRPARDVYVVSILPDSITGGTLGVIRTLLMGSAAISPAVIGFLGDEVGFYLAFTVIAAVAVSATVLAVALHLFDAYR